MKEIQTVVWKKGQTYTHAHTYKDADKQTESAKDRKGEQDNRSGSGKRTSERRSGK